MSKIWQHIEDTCCGTPLNCEIVAFQRMGHGLNWENLSSFIKGTQLHLSCYKLLHQMGRGSTLEESRVEGCDPIHQGTDHS